MPPSKARSGTKIRATKGRRGKSAAAAINQPEPDHQSREPVQLSTALRELFAHVIPPTPLHQAVQDAARQAGWTSPWDREEQQSQKMTAGQRSGRIRFGRAEIRRIFVQAAFEGLKPAYQSQPFSSHSISALQAELDCLINMSIEDGDDDVVLKAANLFAEKQFKGQPDVQERLQANFRSILTPFLKGASPFKTDPETLKKDLKALGIRSKRRTQRSG